MCIQLINSITLQNMFRNSCKNLNVKTINTISKWSLCVYWEDSLVETISFYLSIMNLYWGSFDLRLNILVDYLRLLLRVWMRILLSMNLRGLLRDWFRTLWVKVLVLKRLPLVLTLWNWLCWGMNMRWCKRILIMFVGLSLLKRRVLLVLLVGSLIQLEMYVQKCWIRSLSYM